MSDTIGWDRLRHGGLLLDPTRLRRLDDHVARPLSPWVERELRRRIGLTQSDAESTSDFVAFVLGDVCGFDGRNGAWRRGSQVGTEWTRRGIAGEAIRPRMVWQGGAGALLPVFIDDSSRVGIGRGRRTASQVLQWLRAGDERLALLTNGHQWRLVFAGLDFDAWCEWDIDLWFEEGEPTPQVTALRTLLSWKLWTPPEPQANAPLLQAILDSRKGQAELSAELGERVRAAVELLVDAHGEVLKERCTEVDPAEIYRAAVRVVMRMVVVLFAESRDLLPRDNALYHSAYGLGGLLEELEKIAARGGNRLARSWNAWPRVLALFRLVHDGSHHPSLPVPRYGGELFAPGDPESGDGLVRALAVFETACFDGERMSDHYVHRMLERITRTRVRVRQGRGSTWVAAPVDFSDLSSEYIGILYEGLLDFELKTAPEGDPVIFLAVGNQPALPLSRLEAMDDRAIANLLEKMKDTSRAGDEEAEDGEEDVEAGEAADDMDEVEASADTDDDVDAEEETDADEEETDDARHVTRTRAEQWARKAVEAGKLVRKPAGRLTPERRLAYDDAVGRKARQLVIRVVLPGEWYLVRWGGTRKGSGTFYTRPALAVPTVQRTLRPLAYDPPTGQDGAPDRFGPPPLWRPKLPEAILALKVCDPACGSGTFPVAALRFLTDALYASLHEHGRIRGEGDRAVVRLLEGTSPAGPVPEERLGHELLPDPPDSELFEPRLKAVLRRYVVERCIYGVDLDPLAVELCRLALWIETMDRSLPFSFLDHKIKVGNSLVGAWFDTFQHYPVMAWKNREGGDKNHGNGVHFEKDARGKAIKKFVRERLTPDLQRFLGGRNLELFGSTIESNAGRVHEDALATLQRMHDLPVHATAERERIYREELVGSAGWHQLREAMDRWCACWFWPADRLEDAPLPTDFAKPRDGTARVAREVAATKRFFHWELEFPDVFRKEGSGFDAVVGNPPWETLQPNSKEYFSNIDPLYRTYGKQEALRYQKQYFANREVEAAWLEYTAGFKGDSNWMKFAEDPFGDPSLHESSTDRFAIARGRENERLHEAWRALRSTNHRYTASDHPYRYRGEGKAYTYKLFLEVAHSILHEDGRIGMIVPSGLYSDHGTTALRSLFLQDCRWEWLFGFENREKVFDIDSRFKFNAIIVAKGGATVEIRTAFMRRKLEDWDGAEAIAVPYSREQVERFSPSSRAILEIQSGRDLEILEKIYANSVLLGDEGPDGWGIRYAQGDFNMTSDSGLFPPRPKWESQGYRPDEYSRWLKGKWRPIGELWAELGVRALPEGEHRVAQPPYDTLPVPRAAIPAGFILSREADAWIRQEEIENTALPLYEGRMIGQFDFSQKGWVSGKGRGAVWRDLGFNPVSLEPQFLMAASTFPDYNYARVSKLGQMRVTSATNTRTLIVTALPNVPCGDKVAILRSRRETSVVSLSAVLNAFCMDFQARLRTVGLQIDQHLLYSLAVMRPSQILQLIEGMSLGLSLPTPIGAAEWERYLGERSWRTYWGVTPLRRVEQEVMLNCAVAALMNVEYDELAYILEDCDWPLGEYSRTRSKSFWRVDKLLDPEMRRTVLTVVAYGELLALIESHKGDIALGLKCFLEQNEGLGWNVPESIRLSDYGLGKDERASHPQPVSGRFGKRFLDWQVQQQAEESWRECGLHAQNLDRMEVLASPTP